MIALASNHLGSCITWTSTSRFKRLPLFVSVTQPEINDLNIIILIEKKVLWFEIAMTNLVLVQILNTRKDLLEEFASLPLIEPLFFNDKIEQLSSIGILHYEEKLAVSLNDFVELDDVGVPHYLKDLYLSSNTLNITFIRNFVFLEDLYCHLLSC